jgi:ABC-type branched-subunit amino acid transport system permease subunit
MRRSTALFAIARRLAHSTFGLALGATRENRLRAGALGVDTSRRIVAIYTLAAAYAGAAGALLAQTTQIVSLDLFDFHRSADVMLMLIIGGAGYLYGRTHRRGGVHRAEGRHFRSDARILGILAWARFGHTRAGRP